MLKHDIKEELDSMRKNYVWDLIDRLKQESNGKRPNIILNGSLKRKWNT